jgi:hypothetical protein
MRTVRIRLARTPAPSSKHALDSKRPIGAVYLVELDHRRDVGSLLHDAVGLVEDIARREEEADPRIDPVTTTNVEIRAIIRKS